jgi:hypothetical protein
MTKSEFQQHHGFTSEEMVLLEALLRIFKGKIISIKEVDKD